MICPKCGHIFKDLARVKGGRAGGPGRGFARPEVLARALATRRAKAEARKREGDA